MSIFVPNGDINKNAYLNWNTNQSDIEHNFHLLAQDFEEAALTMLHSVLVDNSDKKADSLIMPILYCIDQSIEVYLKAIISLLNEELKIKEGISKTHDIKSLFETMMSRIKNKEKTTKGLEKNFSALSDYIGELYAFIKPSNNATPKIDFARYPVDTDGTPHFYVASNDQVVIDVEELHKTFKDIVSKLDSIYLMYREERVNGNGQTDS